MIHTFTDFGPNGPYLGQMIAVLRRLAPEVPVIDLLNDAPAFESRLSAYLLAALMARIEPSDIVLAIVDPGVGTARQPLAIEVDGRWLVGPDNGLFELVLRRAESARTHAIAWRPVELSPSFHGRDLFAPVAADLARGQTAKLAPASPRRFADWPDDLAAIVYVDRYGNAMTGMRAEAMPEDGTLRVGADCLARARVFGEVPPGQAFCYVNALGLIEIAMNGASAAERLGLSLGMSVTPGHQARA
ncbi:hypothetical protein SAMN07250955_101154 [Arboricoccus pini]|uniref:SAM-dependent chlorinase/fluorinase n=1 Tax=Arboricoccus pini TaxID=1963835 RepID=A0A212PYA6_9PROT|nr:SAM-dependent chlorinase/fluorinase [Arboricoccus pini]SNB51954.1 hypothetical protein SAMN07250955_101154 [Arboricoccus pini]